MSRTKTLVIAACALLIAAVVLGGFAAYACFAALFGVGTWAAYLTYTVSAWVCYGLGALALQVAEREHISASVRTTHGCTIDGEFVSC